MNRLIRYVFKHKNTGRIETKRCYLSQIETNPTEALAPLVNNADYDLISRDLCFDEEKGVFVGDLINVTTWFGNYIASVKFGEYEQDGSGDEYAPSKCFGFYAEALIKTITDKDGFEIVPDYLVQNSMRELESYKRIGTIYDNNEQREES
ncbi:hypothetical protein CTV96_09675 [Bacillus altitudinis]|uniref:hypothetical protein n=1 Tax=Bacillus altitudinis TaxID=293387 RepID=UPI000C23261C|nr:hypothetical protein [Bacillus altitudinis]PJI12405.1 hypothetical protein CTV96_09675 [Bacillus altitudinis]PKQ85580.1 hypothetical protein CTV98_007420 [Bacillus altitudinis]